MARNTVIEAHAINLEDPKAAARLAEKPVLEPGHGQVLVNMKLRPVNPSDIKSLQGTFGGFPKELPAVPGADGVGVVAKLGAGVAGVTEGQRVTALGWPANEGNGSWQEYVVVAADKLVAVPDDVPDDAAAQFFVNPLTALALLEVAAVPAGKYLLVTAAGSVLSRMLLGAAKAAGIKTIGVVRRAEAVEEVKAAGADEVVVSTSEDLVERVQAITGGEGAWAAVDSVAGDLAYALGHSVRPTGTVHIYGSMGGQTFTGSVQAALYRQVTYKGFWLGPWLKQQGPDGVQAAVEAVWQGIRAGYLRPFTGKTYTLAEYAAAIEESTREGRGGKVLLSS